MLVRCSVVADDVDRLLFRHAPFDGAQELQLLLVAALVHADADHVAGDDFEGCEERSVSVPFVVVRHRPTLGWSRPSSAPIS